MLIESYKKLVKTIITEGVIYMSQNIVYCNMNIFTYLFIKDKAAHIISELIDIYAKVEDLPPDICDQNGNPYQGKLKKFLRLQIKKFVRQNNVFGCDSINEKFSISRKQLNRLLKRNKKPTHISIYVGVIIYFLVDTILKRGGKNYLIQLNDELNFDLTDKIGYYFLQKTYCALIKVCGLEENDGDVSNKNVKAANYIIDSFNVIDRKHKDVGKWYNYVSDGSDDVTFTSPYVNKEVIKC